MKKTYIQPNMEIVRVKINELMNVTSVHLNGSGSVDAASVEADIRDVDFESERTGWEDGLW